MSWSDAGGPGDSVGSETGPGWMLEAHKSVFEKPSSDKSGESLGTSSTPTSQIFESNLTETSEHDNMSSWDKHSGAAVHNVQASQQEAAQSTNLRQKLRWQLGPCIGKGAYAEVFQGIDTVTGKFFAVKSIKINNESSAAAKALQREIDVMTQLPHHRNIVKYLGTEQTEGRLFIFLEYISGGSIASMLEKFGALDECIVRKYTKEVLLGLAFLHASNVVHCDVKGGNILVSEDGVVKLADFNSSKLLENITWGGATPLRSLAGTPQFMAPEVIRQTGHGSKADIWSVGCTVIQMLTASAPWNEISNPATLMFHVGSSQHIPKFPAGISPPCHEFLSNCFQLQPEQRHSCQELLKFAFVADDCGLPPFSSSASSSSSRRREAAAAAAAPKHEAVLPGAEKQAGGLAPPPSPFSHTPPPFSAGGDASGVQWGVGSKALASASGGVSVMPLIATPLSATASSFSPTAAAVYGPVGGGSSVSAAVAYLEMTREIQEEGEEFFNSIEPEAWEDKNEPPWLPPLTSPPPPPAAAAAAATHAAARSPARMPWDAIHEP